MAAGGGDTGETGGTTPTTLDIWSREYLGWATPVNPVAAGPVSFAAPLTSASSAYKLYLPATSTTEYFLVENRTPSSWDLGLKRRLGSGWQGGLLITHIDTTAGSQGSNDINSYAVTIATPGHQGVVPVQASTASCNMLSGTSCRGHATTLFYSGNSTSWSPLSAPNSNYYSGATTNFGLTGISVPGSTMTATLALDPLIVPGAPTGVSATASNASAIVSFTAPATNGGSSILDYTATAYPGGLTATGAASSLTVGGLTNGTSYTFTVTARNANGSGVPSTASNSVTPFDIIKNGSTGYPTVAAAYAALANADVLKLRDITFSENLNFNRSISFSFKGGHEATFTSNSGYSTISGAMTITAGSAIIENIIIQ